MQNALWKSGVLAIALLLPTLLWSGTFRVSPIKVYFEPDKTSRIIKIINEGTEHLKLELDVRQWVQSAAAGQDELTNTRDLIVFPKMLTIEPGKKKIIRVGFRGKPSSAEQTYRLIVKEIPVVKPGEMALKFALRVSVPVFIKSSQAKAALSVASAEVSGGKLHVQVENSGNSHAVVKKVLASGVDAEGKDSLQAEVAGWYVLAGATREFIVDLPEKDCSTTRQLNIDVQEGDNSITSNVQLNAAQCRAGNG